VRDYKPLETELLHPHANLGSLKSAPLLELSGVGNKTLLSGLGIKTLVDLPSVGENFFVSTHLRAQRSSPQIYRGIGSCYLIQ
jgi:hypothetical protein